jgi:hypothetical protein
MQDEQTHAYSTPVRTQRSIAASLAPGRLTMLSQLRNFAQVIADSWATETVESCDPAQAKKRRPGS